MPLNATITESPVILFLGAGASAPLGKPVMEQFIKMLTQEVEAGDVATLLSILISARGHDLESIMGDLETFLSLDVSFRQRRADKKFWGRPAFFHRYKGLEKEFPDRRRMEVSYTVRNPVEGLRGSSAGVVIKQPRRRNSRAESGPGSAPGPRRF